MRALLIFSFFSLLISTGVCLQCEYCHSNTDSCHGVPHTCAPHEKACIILTVEVRKGLEVSLATYKGCTRQSYCTPSPMSIRVPSYHKRRVNKCCQRDLCNSGAVELPPLRLNLNGMQCPGCLSSDTKCPPTEIINCRGWEVFCVFYEVWTDEAGLMARGSSREFPLSVIHYSDSPTIRLLAKDCPTHSVYELGQGVAVYSGIFSCTISKIKECHQAPITACTQHTSGTEPISLLLVSFSVMASFCFLSHASFS